MMLQRLFWLPICTLFGCDTQVIRFSDRYWHRECKRCWREYLEDNYTLKCRPWRPEDENLVKWLDRKM